MSGIRVRASRCLLAALVTMTAACPPTLPREGAAGSRSTSCASGPSERTRASDGLVTLLTAEPLIAVGWDGTPTFALPRSAAESEDGSQI